MSHRTALLPISGHRAWDDLAAWWIARFKPGTQGAYALCIRHWTSWCTAQGLDPMAARRADIERWLREVADAGRYSRSTVASHYDAVASIYRLAYDEELLERNPCARVTRPKVHRELQHREVLTVLEYAAFLAAARALGPNEHCIAVLGGMLGLRASEMAGLTVESISIVRGYSTLTFVGKGDKPARVPIPIPALAAVHAVVDGRDSGPLLRTRTGAAMTRNSVYRYVRRTAAAAGISRPISPHALRRTVGTAALNTGIPLRDVQRLLRHERADTTIRSYDLAGDQLERHASHQISGFLAGFAE